MSFSKELKVSAITVVTLASMAIVVTLLGAERILQLGSISSTKILSFQSHSARTRYPARKPSHFFHRLSHNDDHGQSQFHERMVHIFKKRQQVLTDGCQELERQRREGLYNISVEKRSLMFNVPSPFWFTYCAIPKCSTTTWFNFFTRAAGRSCRQGLNEYQCARKSFRGLSSANKFYSRSLVVVRDPWRRLVSAYENKFVMERQELAARCYRQHNKKVKDEAPITFAEFVRCLLNDYRHGRQLNNHYAPQHWQCWFCKAKYRYIVKLETLSDDFRYLAEVVFPEHNYTAYRAIFSTGLRRPNELRNVTSIIYEDSYRSLTPEDTTALVELYRPDALLFGYPLLPLA